MALRDPEEVRLRLLQGVLPLLLVQLVLRSLALVSLVWLRLLRSLQWQLRQSRKKSLRIRHQNPNLSQNQNQNQNLSLNLSQNPNLSRNQNRSLSPNLNLSRPPIQRALQVQRVRQAPQVPQGLRVLARLAQSALASPVQGKAPERALFSYAIH